MNVLVIKTMSDDSKVRSFLNYPIKNDALTAFYNELAYATSSPDIEGVVVELINDEGRVEKCERYARNSGE